MSSFGRSDPPKEDQGVQAQTKEELLTPAQWSTRVFPSSPSGRVPADYWKHTMAAALHEWSNHEQHAGAPKLLSGETYYACLVAAAVPDKDGVFTPHAAGLSDFSTRKQPATPSTKDVP